MARKVTRRYGMPFHGVNTTSERHSMSLGMLFGDTREMLVSPGRTPDTTKVVRRKGAEIVGSNTGLLEVAVANATMQGVELFEMNSPSLSDGYPTHAVVFVDETKRLGQLYLRDTTGPTDYNIGEEFSSTHYPTSASTVGNLKMPPLPYDGNGATGLTRLAYADNRLRHIPGTRSRKGVRNWQYFPAFYGTPSKWNGRYNRASGSGSEKVRIHPMGHCPPLWAPNFPSASYPTKKSAVAPWVEGDKFFVSCMFEWEDGSFSMPFLPRDINTTLTSGLGLVTVPSDAGTVEYYDYIPWRDIPIGPPGVTKVWLLRTPKVNGTSSWPNIADLRLTGWVPNGTTSYDDPNGNDASLVADSARVRFDHKWPDRARYMWNFDGRSCLGYLRPGPCALILAPSGANVSRDLNGDDSFNGGAYFYTFRITPTDLELRETNGGATNTQTITLSGKSLQQVVDTINATTVASSGGEWVACLVPGVAGSTLATYLAPTTQDLSCTKNSTTTLTSAALFGDVAEGMKVSGTGIPAGTYVKSKASTSSLTLSAAATDSLTSTLTFYTDTGDEAVVLSSPTGNVRCFNGATFGIAAFKQSYLDTFDTNPRDLIMTGGGPTHAQYAANNFYVQVGSRRTLPIDAGVLMGGAPLKEGCVVFGSNRIYLLRNQRSGGSGEDADYRLIELELGRGCISPYSIVSGNGWVGCLTGDGFWVYDGERSAILSGDMLDKRSDGVYVGDWSYEAGVCAASAAKDGTDFGFFAHFRDGRLWCNYRTAGGGSCGIACLDCSPSVESSGIAQLLRQDGSTYGWSARCTYSWRAAGYAQSGAIGSVQKSDKVHLYQCDNTNDKTTCGLVQEFETVGHYLESGSQVAWAVYTGVDLCEALSKKQLHEVRLLYVYSSDPADTTLEMGITVAEFGAPSGSRVVAPTLAAQNFTRKVLRPPANGRVTGDFVWLNIQPNGSPHASAGKFELFGIEADVVVLDSKN